MSLNKRFLSCLLALVMAAGVFLAAPWLVVVFALTSSAVISLLTGKAIGKAAE